MNSRATVMPNKTSPANKANKKGMTITTLALRVRSINIFGPVQYIYNSRVHLTQDVHDRRPYMEGLVAGAGFTQVPTLQKTV